MVIANKALVLDLIEWIDAQPRTYAQVIDAWSTSCPRLPIWEDTVDLGFVAREFSDDLGLMVRVTDSGRAFLQKERPSRPGVLVAVSG
ncbi:MAG TPA: hypothetical protein QF624_01230 [Dehalococcoidia bacterium]|nr:hypothetical protein [Dehalococcoidia bacterium]